MLNVFSVKFQTALGADTEKKEAATKTVTTTLIFGHHLRLGRSPEVCHLQFLNAPVYNILILTGPQIRVCNRKLFFLFLNQNICCGYSKEPSQ